MFSWSEENEKCFHAAKLFGNLEWQQQYSRIPAPRSRGQKECMRRLLPSPESSSSTPGNWTCLLGLVCAGCGEGWGPAKWR